MSEIDLKDVYILVTPTSFGRSDESLKPKLEALVGKVSYNTLGRPLTSGELQYLIPSVDGFIAGLDEIDAAVIRSAKKLKVVSRYGVGIDNVDLQAAKEHNVIVTNTPGANSGSVAELAVGLMLDLARNITPAIESTRKGEWQRFRGISLEGKTVGFIGFGSIGQEVARRLSCFNCQILAYDVAPQHELGKKYNITFASFDEVLAKSDFLSLHCSLVPDTRKLLNDECFSKMKTGAFLINTARGELVDDEALICALESGKISGAGLDVFSKQPPDPSDPLLNHPKVICTPHMASHTDMATNNMGWGAVENCLAVLRGEDPLHRVI